MTCVSVILVNFNTFRLTGDCIRSVYEYTKEVEFELILVDNASTECDPGRFEAEFPQIKLVRSDRNGGFAYGNNLGIAQAAGEYILLLNSDTILKEDAIGNCIAYIKQHPDVGVVGCKMTYPDGGIQYTARRFRSISWELLDLFRFIPLLMPYKKRAKKMLGKYFLHDEEMECDWLNGAFFLFPRSVLAQLPDKKLDDRFFMYGEDQLWCEQIGALGNKIVFNPHTSIIHINSGSTSISRQLALRRTMLKHELEIMRYRKGAGLYYYVFKLIFVAKEGSRNFLKRIVFRLTGRLLR